MKRPGYYVKGQHFADRLHQARARATWLAQEYGRPIDIVFVPHDDRRLVQGDVVDTIHPNIRETV